MNKCGFEMTDEERSLRALDIILDVSIANFVEGFTDSVLTKCEYQDLTDALIKAQDITSKALERYKVEE